MDFWCGTKQVVPKLPPVPMTTNNLNLFRTVAFAVVVIVAIWSNGGSIFVRLSLILMHLEAEWAKNIKVWLPSSICPYFYIISLEKLYTNSGQYRRTKIENKWENNIWLFRIYTNNYMINTYYRTSPLMKSNYPSKFLEVSRANPIQKRETSVKIICSFK